MGRFFVEVDGDDEPTLWHGGPEYPTPVVRRCDLRDPEAWADLVALMSAPFVAVADELEQLCDEPAFGDRTRAVSNTHLRPLIERLRTAQGVSV